jgi:hypothetical protein
VFDQDALQLEGADAVIRALEHIVAAADVVEIAVGIADRLVAGSVVTTRGRSRSSFRIVYIPDHQPARAWRQVKSDFPFARFAAGAVEECHAITREWSAHRAEPHFFSR